MTDKPRHRDGYAPEDFEQVKATCLTLAVTLGAHMKEICIVGGLVPALLVDASRPDLAPGDRHPGTNDLDVGLALAVLDDEHYAAISKRLRAEGFEPDVNAAGNLTVQRWSMAGGRVTVDFLLPPPDGASESQRIHKLEPDFGAIVTPGLELAFRDRVEVIVAGHTLHGEPAERGIPVCGAAAYVVLKALAFGDRAEPKDAFDLTYVLGRAVEGTSGIAARLVEYAQSSSIVAEALSLLQRDFASPEALGAVRAADFMLGDDRSRDESAADAHGYVDDLLRACSEMGLDLIGAGRVPGHSHTAAPDTP